MRHFLKNIYTYLFISGSYPGFRVPKFSHGRSGFFFFFFISRVRHLVVWTLWVWLFDGFQYCRIFLFCWLSFFYFLFLELLLYVGLVLLITFCTIFHFFLFVLSRQGWQVYLSTLVSKFLFFSFKHSFALCSYFYSILFLFHWL